MRHNIFFVNVVYVSYIEIWGTKSIVQNVWNDFPPLSTWISRLEDTFPALYLEGLHLPNMRGHNVSFGLHSSHRSLQVSSVLSHLTITALLGQMFPNRWGRWGSDRFAIYQTHKALTYPHNLPLILLIPTITLSAPHWWRLLLRPGPAELRSILFVHQRQKVVNGDFMLFNEYHMSYHHRQAVYCYI